MRSPTELTMETSVMKGVQKALQRARRRSSLSSSKLFFGNGLSTIFDQDGKLTYVFPADSPVASRLYIMSTRRSPTHRSHGRKYYLSTKLNSITRKHHAQEEPRHRRPSPLDARRALSPARTSYTPRRRGNSRSRPLPHSACGGSSCSRRRG